MFKHLTPYQYSESSCLDKLVYHLNMVSSIKYSSILGKDKKLAKRLDKLVYLQKWDAS